LIERRLKKTKPGEVQAKKWERNLIERRLKKTKPGEVQAKKRERLLIERRLKKKKAKEKFNTKNLTSPHKPSSTHTTLSENL
jgi:hypothetical protein